MKALNNIRILLFTLSFSLIVGFVGKVNAQPGITVSFQQFYDELSPYGEWVDDPDYGYIWIPNVEPDFQPYATNGRWVMTDYGNTWVSNYDWGWAPFHYGRWNYNNRFGWCWVPGYEWGPAWVSWRSGGGYYGWAPLSPGLSIGVNINIPSAYWIFVPQRYILSSAVHRYYAPRRSIVNVYNRTTIINNTYVYNNHRYYSGPGRSDIQRVTRSSVPVHRINNASRPGSGRITGRSLEIYRPNINRNDRAARPARIVSADNIRSNENRSMNRRNENAGRPTTRPSSRSDQMTNRSTGRTERRPDIRRVERNEGANRPATEPRNRNSEIRRSQRVQSTPNNMERPSRSNNSNQSVPTNSSRVQRSEEQYRRPSSQPRMQRSEQPRMQRSEQPRMQRSEQPRMQRSEQPRMQRSEQPRSGAPSRSERPSRGQDHVERMSRSIRG